MVYTLQDTPGHIISEGIGKKAARIQDAEVMADPEKILTTPPSLPKHND